MRRNVGPVVLPALLLALAAGACETPRTPTASPVAEEPPAIEVAPEPEAPVVAGPAAETGTREPAALWPVEGTVELHALAARAKLQKRRLLLGLSGGAT